MTPKKPITREETETVWSLTCDGMELYTTDKVMMQRYEKFSKAHPEQCQLIKEDEYGMTFKMDPRCIGLKPRAIHKAPALTEEQMAANAERLRAHRTKQKAL